MQIILTLLHCSLTMQYNKVILVKGFKDLSEKNTTKNLKIIFPNDKCHNR